MPIVAHHAVAIACEHFIDNPEQAFLGQPVVDVGGEREPHLVPYEAGAGRLLEEVARRLEHDRVGEHRHPAGGLAMRPGAAELHQRKFHQPDIDHVAGHAADLDAVTGLDSESPD